MADSVLQHGFHAHPPGRSVGTWQAGERTWNIGYTISGTVREILAQGETWEQPHDLMILKSGGSHAWEVPRDVREPWRVIWFVFVPKPEWIPLLDLPEEFPRFSRIALAGRKYDGKIRRSLLQAHRFAISPAGGQALAMNALERALLWLQAELKIADVRIDRRVQATIELFFKRLVNPPSIPEAAAACGLSPSRLGGLFRECIGQTPQRWLERTRLNHARDLLLTTGLPVKLVTAACGYNDQRHFATRFRRYLGLTPTQCRKHVQKKPHG
ncbi:MAG: helix-turn-helix domain-containing protein [Kiritimatiellae bacterium]|nr:helix-turn-helix domain-containing protein [Kiritimatiellia bacterium]